MSGGLYKLLSEGLRSEQPGGEDRLPDTLRLAFSRRNKQHQRRAAHSRRGEVRRRRRRWMRRSLAGDENKKKPTSSSNEGSNLDFDPSNIINDLSKVTERFRRFSDSLLHAVVYVEPQEVEVAAALSQHNCSDSAKTASISIRILQMWRRRRLTSCQEARAARPRGRAHSMW